ncbi:MurR/RpiR family transcriptional regulator [Limnochorda pilosa]|uniref:Transcriptional regulator n=1 Tax=Limnochorda pilosa TaxID=1555112 RepID=A0A0K2SMC1_LIMPI|nr:MurR/RpiR family transcriptional regulator [Limnochorda pilosa]BAS28273.1 transcriptional regulator [Limnochorda pilosa]
MEPTTNQAPPGCLARIRASYSSLRPSERRVADFVLKQPERVTALSVTEMAARAQTSESTVVKLAQRLGYKGYQQLKMVLAGEVGSARTAEGRIYGEIRVGDSLADIKEKLIRSEMQGLQETLPLLDEESLARSQEAILGARRIHFYGVGASGMVALDAQHKFARIGLPAWAYVDPHQATAFASLLREGDVAIGISYSGNTLDVLEAIQTAGRAGATTVAITAQMGSPLARAAAITLVTGAVESPFRSGAMVSRICQLAVVDILFIAVAVRRPDESFASLERSHRAVEPRHGKTS